MARYPRSFLLLPPARVLPPALPPLRRGRYRAPRREHRCRLRPRKGQGCVVYHSPLILYSMSVHDIRGNVRGMWVQPRKQLPCEHEPIPGGDPDGEGEAQGCEARERRCGGGGTGEEGCEDRGCAVEHHVQLFDAPYERGKLAPRVRARQPIDSDLSLERSNGQEHARRW